MNPEPIMGKIGRYEIIEELGRGGMAVVYRGHDSELHREVAVKVLPETLAHDQQFVQRFRDEAIMAARLRHPNIVTVYDVGQVGHSYYIVMQYIRGANLDHVIESSGALPIDTAVGIAARVAAALDAAHQNGIIHRDVKPSNIMISTESEVTLMDFGLVRAAESSSHITRTGTVVGTPEYMSPEQAQGQPVDQRTDVYSLGVVVYKMLNGTSPFARSTPLATLLAQTKDLPTFAGPVMGRLPRDVRRVLERAMAKAPGDRYASAGAFAADLAKAAGVQPNRPILVRLPPPYGPVDQPGRPVAAALAATGAGSAPTALVPPPASTQTAGGFQGGGTAVRLAGPGRRSWLFALIPLLLLVAAGVGFFAVRAGSRPAAAPEVVPQVGTEERTATVAAPTLEPTATLAVVGPALTTPTETAIPATSTPVVVEKTVVSTSTPLVVEKTVVVVVTSASPPPPSTRSTTATALPKPATTPAKAAATASPRPPPTRSTALAAPALIAPPDGASTSGPIRFEWTWSGPALEPNQGFEVRIWREGQPEHYGAAAPVTETSLTTDVSGSYAVQQGGSGSYFWTAALVQRDPYARLGPEAPPRVLLVTVGGGGTDSGQPW
jgi:hypothetical protein